MPSATRCQRQFLPLLGLFQRDCESCQVDAFREFNRRLHRGRDIGRQALPSGRYADSGLDLPQELRAQRRPRRRTASGSSGGRSTQSKWKGQPRSSDTHASTTAPVQEYHNNAAILSDQGHLLMENPSGLAVGAVVTHADGMGERAVALAMLDTVPGAHRQRVATEKAYDTHHFIGACRQRRIKPHVASHDSLLGGIAIDERTTWQSGYANSQTIRNRIEDHFGRGKPVGQIRQTGYMPTGMTAV